MNKRLLIIAGALSAFALVFLGSVFAKMQERTVAENNPAPQLPAPQLGAPLVAPSENGALVASASSAMPPAQTINTTTTPNPSAAPSTRLSSSQAQQIAQQAQPSARIQGAPELVRYGGRLAYEVPFAQGKIYVNADSGTILGNSMAQATSAVQPNNSYGERDDDEHEYREHRKKRGEHKKHDQDDDDDDDDHEERENV